MSSIEKQSGITILELMMSLAIVAIVITTVTPSVQTLIIQNRIVAELNELSSLFQYARANAIDEQIDTVLCPTTDYEDCSTNWNHAKMMFADLDGNGNRGTNEELLASSSPISSVNTVTGPAASIAFQGNGTVSSPATVLFCHKDKKDQYARAIILSLQGRVKLSRDTDNDGIHEYNNGSALDCGS